MPAVRKDHQLAITEWHGADPPTSSSSELLRLSILIVFISLWSCRRALNLEIGGQRLSAILPLRQHLVDGQRTALDYFDFHHP
jgi:hypothetical protein